MKKKFIPLLLLPFIGLTSCSSFSDEAKIKIDSNIDTFLYEKDNEYQKADTEDILAKLSLKAGFAIYFTKDGCSSCKQFSPIMDSYLKSSNMLVYKYDTDNDVDELNKLKESIGDKLFAATEDKILQTPSVFVLHDDNVDQVDYSSYMKTNNAFNNYMNRTYKVREVYYSKCDVFETSFTNKEFAYVTFQNSDATMLDRYIRKVEPYVHNSSHPVIITNTNDSERMDLKLCGKNKNGESYSRLEFGVSEDTGDSVFKQIFY